MSRAGLLAVAAVAAALGCGRPGGEPSLRVGGDTRYAVELHAADAPAEGWRLRVEALEGWHIVPEAPARLHLEAPAGFAFRQPRQRGTDALEHSEARLEFALAAEGAHAAPESPARADLKFGLCRDDAEGCDIVRESFDLPLARIAAR